MDKTEPARDAHVGPAERPDDPLAAARFDAARRPAFSRPRLPATGTEEKVAPPTPDQEGCYFLG